MRPRIRGAIAPLLSSLQDDGESVSDTIHRLLYWPAGRGAIMGTLAGWEFPGEGGEWEMRPRVDDDTEAILQKRREGDEPIGRTISREIADGDWGGIDVDAFATESGHSEPYIESVAQFAEWYDEPRPPSAWDVELWVNSLAEEYAMSTVKRNFFAIQAYFKFEVGDWDVTEPTDRQEMLDALHDLADRLGKTPTSRDVQADAPSPPLHEFQDEFGSWNEALQAAGLEPNEQKPGNFTDEELVEDLREFADEIGSVPTSAQMLEDGPHAVSTYINRFGGWVAALDAAGMDVRDRYGEAPEIEG